MGEKSLSGNKPRSILPEPGQDLSEIYGYGAKGIYKVIWRPRGSWSSWRAKCQKCEHEWRVRSRPWNSSPKMPVRCPECHTRNWFVGNKTSYGQGDEK